MTGSNLGSEPASLRALFLLTLAAWVYEKLPHPTDILGWQNRAQNGTSYCFVLPGLLTTTGERNSRRILLSITLRCSQETLSLSSLTVRHCAVAWLLAPLIQGAKQSGACSLVRKKIPVLKFTSVWSHTEILTTVLLLHYLTPIKGNQRYSVLWMNTLGLRELGD